MRSRTGTFERMTEARQEADALMEQWQREKLTDEQLKDVVEYACGTRPYWAYESTASCGHFSLPSCEPVEYDLEIDFQVGRPMTIGNHVTLAAKSLESEGWSLRYYDYTKSKLLKDGDVLCVVRPDGSWYVPDDTE